VPELARFEGEIIGCFARAAALDVLAEGTELALRVAPTELLLIAGGQPLSELAERLDGLDPGGLAVDLTSAYAAWSVRGEDRLEAFARLSAVPLPETAGFAQGLVAHVPAKVVVREDDLLVLVSSVVSEHLHTRFLAVSRAGAEAAAR
jgi:hypothetical protein